MASATTQHVSLPWRGTRSTEREAFISDFSPPPSMELFLNDILQRRTPGTCRIAYDDADLRYFIEGRHDRHFRSPTTQLVTSILDKIWLHDFQGSGKTFLAATAVEQLIKCASSLEAVCYYFITLHDVATQKPENVLRTLLCQLAQQSFAAYRELRKCVLEAAPPGICAEMGYAWEGGFDYLYYRPLLQLFESMTRHFTRVTLVVNNITRYGGREDLDAWEVVVQVFADVVKRTGSRLRVLFTSDNGVRDGELMVNECDFCPIFARVSEGELRLYVRGQLERRIAGGEECLRSEEVRRWLEDYLAIHSNGSFTWINAQLDLQCKLIASKQWQHIPVERTQTDVIAEQRFGPDPNNFNLGMVPYEANLQYIVNQQDKRTQFIVERMIHWAQIDRRVNMTIDQACEALNKLLVRHGLAALGSQVNADEVLGSCGSLIRLGVDKRTFELAHESVARYVATRIPPDKPELAPFRTDRDKLEQMREELATVCFETLREPTLVWMPSTLSQDQERIKRRDKQSPLYGLAASHWHNICHSDWGDDVTDDFMSPLFQTGTAPFASWVLEHRRRRFIHSLPPFAAPAWGEHPSLPATLYNQLAAELAGSSITALHIAAAFSKPNLCNSIRKQDAASSANTASELMGSALHCALVGRAALAVGVDEPPWRRYGHYDRGNEYYDVGTDRWSLATTISCLSDRCMAIWHESGLHAPAGQRDTFSIAADLLAACFWMHDGDLFISIMEKGKPLAPVIDRGFVEAMRNRWFLMRPHSLQERPVPAIVFDDLREFMNDVHFYLMQRVRSELNTGDVPEEERVQLEELQAALVNNMIENTLECGQAFGILQEES